MTPAGWLDGHLVSISQAAGSRNIMHDIYGLANVQFSNGQSDPFTMELCCLVSGGLHFSQQHSIPNGDALLTKVSFYIAVLMLTVYDGLKCTFPTRKTG